MGFLVENYKKQETEEYHLEKKSFDNNISNIIAALRDCIYRVEKDLKLEKKQINSIREKWFDILDFVNPILRFASSFPDYLIPFSYFNLISSIEKGENSVRAMVGFNERIIFSLSERYSDVEKLYKLEKNILNIQLILREDSNFYRLLKNRTTNFNEMFFEFCKDLLLSNIPLKINDNNLLINLLHYDSKFIF